MTARNDPIAPTQIAAGMLTTVAITPPMTWPIGIVPHTMNRIVAFMRPCIGAGVMACRKLTWLML